MEIEAVLDGEPTSVITMDEELVELLTRGGISIEELDLGMMKKERRRDTPFMKLSTACEKLAPRMSKEDKKTIPKKWEILGDLVLLPPGSFVGEEWAAIGPALWGAVAASLRVKRVAMQAAIDKGPMRQSHAKLLLGEDGWVEHVQHGITYHIEVTKVMFSSGNVTERKRQGAFQAEGEVVVDLFVGIGYFSVPILKQGKCKFLYACEWNPDSIECLNKNLVANGVADRCEVRQGDNREVAPIGVADRVLLGLIPTSEMSWATGVKALKPTGGWMHVHENVQEGEEDTMGERMCAALVAAAAALGQSLTATVEHIEKVKPYSPRVNHLVYDVRLC